MVSREIIEAAESAGLHCFGHPDPILEIPTPWEIVEDDKGYLNIHHPREDDGTHTGDLVATCFQDERHANMIAAAPELLAACEALDAMWLEDWKPPHVDTDQEEPRIITAECLAVWRNIRAAIAKARGEG